MKESFIGMLRGNTNTLGRTDEVVQAVLDNNDRLEELFSLFYQDDEWVRLRTNSALKRIWRIDQLLVSSLVERWVKDVAVIDQPSISWTFAQLVDECPDIFSEELMDQSIELIKGYLDSSEDWIVLNSSVQTLSKTAVGDPDLLKWLRPRLKKLSKDTRKSVASRASKALESLGS